MINIIPNSPYFGKLEVKTVYEYYEGPRLFSSVNGAGNIYIVFWIDSDETSDDWLYASISREKLELLENKMIKLRDVFVYPDDLIFKVKTYFEASISSEVSEMPLSKLDDTILPPGDFYIDIDSSSSKTFLIPSQESDISELYIKSLKTRSQPALNTIGKISDLFSDFYKAVLNSLDIKNKSITAVDARRGSFILRLKTPNISDCLPTIINVFKVLNDDDPYDKLIEMGIDTVPVEALLEEIINGKVKIQFGLENNHIAELTMSEDKAIEVLAKLNVRSSSYISSLYVPQANDLDKVFKLVDMKAKGAIISPESIGLTTDRQVSYYLHAARMLDLLSKSNAINSAGFQFSGMDQVQRLNTASIRFESSKCGWAWLKWAGKSRVYELDPNTAETFLLEKCSTLSKNTAIRRAKTLKKWQIIMSKNNHLITKSKEI